MVTQIQKTAFRYKWIGLLAIQLSFAAPTEQETRKAYGDSYQLEAKERYLEAIQALSPVLAAYGNTYTVNYRTGWLYYRNKSWNESIKYYAKSLSVSPQSIEALNSILAVYGAKQDWKMVDEQALRILKIDRNNVIANHWLILAALATKQNEKALKNVLRMLTIYPTSTTFLNELGKIQYLNGQFSDSYDTFTGLQILDPYNQSAAYYLGLIKKK
jgi:tetratricopeptide (TPR) repeat protein